MEADRRPNTKRNTEPVRTVSGAPSRKGSRSDLTASSITVIAVIASGALPVGAPVRPLRHLGEVADPGRADHIRRRSELAGRKLAARVCSRSRRWSQDSTILFVRAARRTTGHRSPTTSLVSFADLDGEPRSAVAADHRAKPRRGVARPGHGSARRSGPGDPLRAGYHPPRQPLPCDRHDLADQAFESRKISPRQFLFREIRLTRKRPGAFQAVEERRNSSS